MTTAQIVAAIEERTRRMWEALLAPPPEPDGPFVGWRFWLGVDADRTRNDPKQLENQGNSADEPIVVAPEVAQTPKSLGVDRI